MAGLSPRNFSNAVAAQKTFLGGNTFKSDFEKDQRESLAKDAALVLREYDIEGDTEVIGKGVSRKKLNTKLIPSVARKQKFGSIVTFNLSGQVDLLPIANEIIAKLRSLSEPFRDSGTYLKSHRIVRLDKKKPPSFIYVSTGLPYAAKLERPKKYFKTGRTYRVYQRTALWASKKWVGEAHIWLTGSGPNRSPAIEIKQFTGQRQYSARNAPKWGKGGSRRGRSYASVKGRR